MHIAPGGSNRSENWWGCAAGRWNLDPKRLREKWNLGPKRSNSVRIGSFNTPKDRFGVGGWEKIPQKDRVQSSQCQKRGSKRRHIHITQYRGSTLPGISLITIRKFNGSNPDGSLALASQERAVCPGYPTPLKKKKKKKSVPQWLLPEMCSERDSPLEPFVLSAPGQPELARLTCGAHLGPPVLTRKQKCPRVNSLVCDRAAAFCAAGLPEALSWMSRLVTQAAKRERELARAHSQAAQTSYPEPARRVSFAWVRR